MVPTGGRPGFVRYLQRSGHRNSVDCAVVLKCTAGVEVAWRHRTISHMINMSGRAVSLGSTAEFRTFGSHREFMVYPLDGGDTHDGGHVAHVACSGERHRSMDRWNFRERVTRADPV